MSSGSTAPFNAGAEAFREESDRLEAKQGVRS